MEKRVSYLRVILLILLLVLIAVAIIYFLTHKKVCKDNACFMDNMQKCSKAEYLNDAPDAAWLYAIDGRVAEDGDKLCKINVKLVAIKKGSVEMRQIEGLDMDCYLPLGFIGTPHYDLSKCHGNLKEGMQDMIINKLHSYILENIGRISEELTRAV
jgi:hypothetical protein